MANQGAVLSSGKDPRKEFSMARKGRSQGIDNVLVDLGFEDAEELSAKTLLAMKLNAVLDARNLTQARAAKMLGMPQPKVSAIRNYKLRGVSLERLMQALMVLGQHVRIVVRPSGHKTPARIDVVA